MKQYIFIITLIIIASCSPGVSLSNDEALSLLKEKYDGTGCYQYIEVVMNRDKNNAYASEIINTYFDLQKQNLLDVKKSSIPGWNGRGTRYTVQIPQALREQYLSRDERQVLMYKNEILDILGISINQEAKTAVVKFSFRRTETPYRKLITRKKSNSCKPGNAEREMEFVFYDTGWQIKSKK